MCQHRLGDDKGARTSLAQAVREIQANAARRTAGQNEELKAFRTEAEEVIGKR